MTGQKARRVSGTDGGSVDDAPDRIARPEDGRSGGPTGPALPASGGRSRAMADEVATKTPPVAPTDGRGTAVEPLSG